ncbi:hypothetical protein BU16DRAFT_556519 [Lophium mytilinum]|uniref:ELYS-like domain-containing protein n=1 Tax=Lophium mytilinum TaxID=390894 RepID=A0A6A6R847_9PEZI|nr:hypothetical protein BU16DRAFT_556519 [Lophium mytilinum]
MPSHTATQKTSTTRSSPIGASSTTSFAHHYPPRTPSDLAALHKTITHAPIPDPQKQCLLFYLLKDLSPSTHTEHELAAAFATATLMPQKLWTFMEGLHALDRQQFLTAVEFLSHPSLLPTYTEEVLECLLKHARGGEDEKLALAYFHAVRPPLERKEVRDKFVDYLAERSVVEAFYFVRGRPEDERRGLVEIVVASALGAFSGVRKAARGAELVDLPLDEEEEGWVEEYLVEGKGRNLHGARDTVMARRIATGRYRQALHDGGVKGRRYDEVTWDVVKDGLARGLGDRSHEEPFVVV